MNNREKELDKIHFYDDLYHNGKFFKRRQRKSHIPTSTDALKKNLLNSKSEPIAKSVHFDDENLDNQTSGGRSAPDLRKSSKAETGTINGQTEKTDSVSIEEDANLKASDLLAPRDIEETPYVDTSDVTDVSHKTYEEDRSAKILIKDILIYILFVICAAVIQFSMSSRGAVYFTNNMKVAFMDTAFHHVEILNDDAEVPNEEPATENPEPDETQNRRFRNSDKTFRADVEGGTAEGRDGAIKSLRTATTIQDFWEFAETTFVDMMFWEFWYSYKNPVTEAKPEDQLVFYSSKLLGVARIRQLRVKKDSCEIPDQVSHLFKDCYGYYSHSDEDESQIPAKDSIVYTGTAWKYSASDLLRTTSYYGKFARYGGGGYYADMSLERTESRQRIEELKSNLWIDRATRCIIIDFTVYNTNVNLFVVSKLVIEFPPTGGIYPTGEFSTLKLLRYVSDQDFIVMGFEFAFIFFIIYYTVMAALDIMTYGMQYFKRAWNILNIIILLFGYASIIFGVYRYLVIEPIVAELMNSGKNHPPFDVPGQTQRLFNQITTITLFFIFIKLFKYLQFNQTVNDLDKTLARSTKALLSFTIMFCIIFFAFAQFAYLIFGTEVEDYRTVWVSSMSLILALLGKLDYRELEESNFVLGPLFLILFVFFIFFVLMNMFGAIIIESYKIVTSQIAPAKEKLVEMYLGKAIKNLMSRGKRKPKKISEKLITYSNIRDALHRAGFKDVEIDIFFAKYNINTDFDATSSEAKKLITQLELRKFDFDPVDSNAQTVAVLQKEFEKMKTYVAELENKVELLRQKLKARFGENHAGSTQTPDWS